MTETQDSGPTPSGQGAAQPSLVKATLISLAVAAVILVTVVLPAEYGLDPLGTGALLGLDGLSRTGPGAIIEQTEAPAAETVRFELAPFESVEYKYRMEQDASVVFTWTASGEVLFDMHAEPDGAEQGYAESFAVGRGASGNGTYVAPFPGIHGWFWENRGMQTVTVEISTAGFYAHGIEFRDGDQAERQQRSIREVVKP